MQVTTEKRGKNDIRVAKVFGLSVSQKGVNINRKNFCDGFRRLFVNLNDSIGTMNTAGKNYKQSAVIQPLTINDLKATSYDLIRVYNNETKCENEALFPVDFECKHLVQFDGVEFKVTTWTIQSIGCLQHGRWTTRYTLWLNIKDIEGK